MSGYNLPMGILPLNKCVIYALVDPRDGCVRYVGATSEPSARLKEHMRHKGTSSRDEWIRDLVKEKFKPVFVFLDSVQAEKAHEAELEWIAHFGAISELHNYKSKK